jgi:uncharacterized protein YmfQ (DUF2313 family)
MARLPVYTDDDYTQAFLNLLPDGRIWDKDPGSPMAQVVAALVPPFTVLSNRASNLIDDAFIGSTTELLPEWEASLGLPDPCLGTVPTVPERRAEAVARFVGLGGQSIPFYVAYAAALGYTITITEFAPFRVDYSKTDTPLFDGSVAYTWQVIVSGANSWTFKVDLNTADERLGDFGNGVLVCELTRLAPAYTQLLFGTAPVLVGGGTLCFDPGTIGINALLSSDLLTIASIADVQDGAFGFYTTPMTTGNLYYWEMTINAATNYQTGVGFGVQDFVFTDLLSANPTDSFGIYQDGGGNLWVSNTVLAFGIGALLPGTIVSFAVDLVNNLAYVRVGTGDWNNDSSDPADPTVPIGGFDISALAAIDALYPYATVSAFNDSITCNFTADTVYPPPTNFSTFGS